jgi:hypothetical protein
MMKDQLRKIKPIRTISYYQSHGFRLPTLWKESSLNIKCVNTKENIDPIHQILLLEPTKENAMKTMNISLTTKPSP